MIKVNEIVEKVSWVATVFLLSSITIFESYTWGKYILILTSMIIFLLDIWGTRGRYYLSLNKYFYFILTLIIYSFMGIIWGINGSDCLTKAYTYLQILICMMILYQHFNHDNGVKQLLSIVKWSSYIISIYSIMYYGLDFIIKMITSGVRLENSYTNINTIGMFAAIGIIIQLDEMKKNHKFYVSTVFCVPAFMMVIATQSRKALLILIIGSVMVLIFRSVKKGRALLNILKIIIIICGIFVVLKYASGLTIFSGINKRMNYIVAMFTGTGEIGQSALTRNKLINLGMEIFRKNPLVGVGMGCPRIIAKQVLNFDAYLHNNFIELLAAGGIIGFALYYIESYIYLFIEFYKLRNYKDENFIICVILSIILLFRDYAMVSMYSKITFVYFLIFFLEIEKTKDRKRSYKGVKKNES